MSMSNVDYFNQLYKMKTNNDSRSRRRPSTPESQNSPATHRPPLSTASSYSGFHNSLSKTMTHSGQHGKFELGSHVTNQVYAYKTVKYHNLMPKDLKPVSPGELLNGIKRSVQHTDGAASPGRRGSNTYSSVPPPLTTVLGVDDDQSIVTTASTQPSPDNSDEPITVGKHKSINSPMAKQFHQRVSFDTVNIQYAESPLYYPEFNSGDEESMGFRRDRFASSTASKTRQSLLDLDGGWGPSSGKRDPSPGGHYAASRRARSPELSPNSSSHRNRSCSAERRSMSPTSVKGGSLSPSAKRIMKAAKDELRKYPSKPIVTHDACTLTKKHLLYDGLYAGKLRPEIPKLANRSILCYISGRKHTWVALDWCCNRLLEDGDTLVVIASINPTSHSSLVRKLSGDYHGVSSLITEDKVRHSPEYAKIVADNIMKYILSLLNPKIIVKITIELAVGSTKDVLKDMYSLYQPSMVVTSAKPSLAPSTKSWLTSRITDRLVKNFPVPVIIAPAKNMSLFQTKLFEVLDKRIELIDNGDYTEEAEHSVLNELDGAGQFHLKDHLAEIKKNTFDEKLLKKLNALEKKLNAVPKAKQQNEDDSQVEHTIKNPAHMAETKSESNLADEAVDESTDEDDSDASEDSAYSDDEVHAFEPSIPSSDEEDDDDQDLSPQSQIKKMGLSTQINVYKELSDLQSKPVDKDTFKQWISLVSKEAYKYGKNLAEQAKSGGEKAKLVRTLTGAPDGSYGRQKSMLLDDPPAATSKLSPLTPYATHKKSMLDVGSPYEGISSKPRTSGLKFSDNAHPKYTGATPNITVSPPTLNGRSDTAPNLKTTSGAILPKSSDGSASSKDPSPASDKKRGSITSSFLSGGKKNSFSGISGLGVKGAKSAPNLRAVKSNDSANAKKSGSMFKKIFGKR